ncbi:btk-binding protein-related [Anaeramoeba ignava]|uniref:Btk-binding protein-related n=1 Tax=Anaeramoeba ignava TaxID=1746090 RepID=A0A9Q0L5X9_ANAIG|nr:btk-binding protein-related [Anaeramoeba ignava]
MEHKKNEFFFFGRKTFEGLKPETRKEEKEEEELIMKPTEIKPLKNHNDPITQVAPGYTSITFLTQKGQAFEYTQESEDYKEIEVFDEEQAKKGPQIIKKISAGLYIQAVLTTEGHAFGKGKDVNKNSDVFFPLKISDSKENIFIDVVCGEKAIYLLSQKGNAYGIGSNTHGQLGFEPPRKSESLNLLKRNIERIFSGICSNSVFLITRSNMVFVCGDNFYGQLGLEKNNLSKNHELREIEELPKRKIIDIKLGNYHTLMLVEDDNNPPPISIMGVNPLNPRTLYSCGRAGYNGISEKDDISQFTEVKSSLFKDDNILEISVGMNHSLILTANGKMIGFGCNEDAQLGTGNTDFHPTPFEIKLPDLFFDIDNYHITCGDFNSFLYYSFFSSILFDLLQLFEKKELCDITFQTKGENISAHRFILNYRIGTEDQIDEFREYISQKSSNEANEIFQLIYGNYQIDKNLREEFQFDFNLNESMIDTLSEMNFSQQDRDFEIVRIKKEIKKEIKKTTFHKIILFARSKFFNKKFQEDANMEKYDEFNDFTDESFDIFQNWIYTNNLRSDIVITKTILQDLQAIMTGYGLNQTIPNIVSQATELFNRQKMN